MARRAPVSTASVGFTHAKRKRLFERLKCFCKMAHAYLEHPIKVRQEAWGFRKSGKGLSFLWAHRMAATKVFTSFPSGTSWASVVCEVSRRVHCCLLLRRTGLLVPVKEKRRSMLPPWRRCNVHLKKKKKKKKKKNWQIHRQMGKSQAFGDPLGECV